jgi:hypothetical protein
VISTSLTLLYACLFLLSLSLSLSVSLSVCLPTISFSVFFPPSVSSSSYFPLQYWDLNSGPCLPLVLSFRLFFRSGHTSLYPSSIFDPSTHASHVAGIIDVNHHTKFVWYQCLKNFSTGLTSNHGPLISASQVTGIKSHESPFPAAFSFLNCLFAGRLLLARFLALIKVLLIIKLDKENYLRK